MAKTETIAGVVPVPRGPYDSGNTYYKYNLTQLYGSTYMSKIDDNTTAPATMDAEGNITVNENWEVWADASGIPALQKEIEKRYKTIGFAGIVDDAISSASFEEDGSPSNVYYSSQLKAFVLKSGEVYYTTWNNAGLWNDVSNESSPVAYLDCYYLGSGNLYVFNGTNLYAIGGEDFRKITNFLGITNNQTVQLEIGKDGYYFSMTGKLVSEPFYMISNPISVKKGDILYIENVVINAVSVFSKYNGEDDYTALKAGVYNDGKTALQIYIVTEDCDIAICGTKLSTKTLYVISSFIYNEILKNTLALIQYDESILQLKKEVRFPYDNNYLPNETTINNGAATMLIDGYVDIVYEDGQSYSLAKYSKDNNYFIFYKKPKDINATAENLTKIGEFDISGIEGSEFHLLIPRQQFKDILGNSWFIVKLPENTYTNAYDYNGCGLSPKIFKGGINSNILLNQRLDEIKKQCDTNSNKITENSSAILALQKNFTETITEEKNWEQPLKIGSNTSTFSGWGMIIGTNIRVKSAKIQIANRGEEAMTKVRFKFFADTYEGELLTQKDVEVNIQQGAIQEVECILDTPISYNGNIYMIYLCDQICTSYVLNNTSEAEKAYSKYTPADNVSFPKLTYVTNGNLDGKPLGVTTFGYNYVYGVTLGIAKQTLSEEIKEQIKDEVIDEVGKSSNAGLEVILPDVIYATVDDKLQLFYRGMIKAVNLYVYDILVACSKGLQKPRYFEYSPKVEDIGETTFNVKVRNIAGDVLAEKTCRLITSAKGVSPSNKINIACFGDSLTSAGTWCRELDRRLTENGGSPAGLGLTNIEFVGSKTNGTTGYFGVGGWVWESYTQEGRPAYRFQVSGVTTLNAGDTYTNNGNTFTVMEVNVTEGTGNILCSVSSLNPAPQPSGVLTKSKGNGDATITYSSVEEDTQNPLWDKEQGKMTFVPYVDKYCDGQIDCVITLLSWNGQTAHRTDFTSVITQIEKFADTLHSEYPQCKLKLCGIQVPSLNGGMGANYGATGSGYADTYGMVVTALNMNKAYQEFANRDEYKDFVEFVNVSAQFDSEYNMPKAEVAANSRNSTNKEFIGTNGVHPDTSGYYQIADVLYRNIVSNFCK